MVCKGATEGGEIAPEWRPTSFWRLRGSYSYLHMNLGKAPGSGDIGTAPTIEGSSPAHQVDVRSSIDYQEILPVRSSLSLRQRSSGPTGPVVLDGRCASGLAAGPGGTLGWWDEICSSRGILRLAETRGRWLP